MRTAGFYVARFILLHGSLERRAAVHRLLQNPPGAPVVPAAARLRAESRGLERFRGRELRGPVRPGRSVHGQRANFTTLVLGCIEGKVCKLIHVNTKYT